MLGIFGKIQNPFQRMEVPGYAGEIGVEGIDFGLIVFLNNILKLVIVLAGIFAFLNVIIAGYQFMTAMGDPKGITVAWNRIWQSLIGLILIAGSFVLAAIFGWLLFGDATAILQPKIFGPETVQ